MKATKKEVIREAYGKHWEELKEHINHNGWCSAGGEEFLKEVKSDFQYTTDGNRIAFRPKVLEDIDNNNGWLIVSSDETPAVKDGVSYDLYDAEEDRIYYRIQGMYTVLNFVMLPSITHIRVTRNDKPLYKCEQ